ncbi:hypothetical protein LPJ56_002336 [Coemansia sp. RSA 2599]|nr:hypothetical protein LPJ56_002336 [Coemansia sp. RSA 2599]
MPITPMTSVTPPMTANPAALHDSADQRRLAPALPAAPECDASSTISSAKRRRRANGDGEPSATRRRRDQRASPAPAAAEAAAADGQKKPVSAGSSEAPAADEPTGVEAARILEERRRRNASASARFRKRRNERERELVNRCVFLEQQLLQIMGPKLFEEIMRKAPSAHTSTADSTSLLVTARRSMIASAAAAGTVSVSAMAFSAASSRAPSPKEDDDFGDDADDDLHSCRGESGSGISVSALTAPKSVDDVWSAYLALSQQMAGALQRIKALENSPAKD